MADDTITVEGVRYDVATTDNNGWTGTPLTYRGVPVVYDEQAPADTFFYTNATTTPVQYIMTNQATMNAYENLLVADQRYVTTWQDVKRSENNFWRAFYHDEPAQVYVEVDEGL